MSGTKIKDLPIFPIDAHIFPGGKLRLRIFEPRYVRLIKERSSEEKAFAMAMYSHVLIEQEPQLLTVATMVKLVDFEHLEDGFLGITVEGIGLVKILSVLTEEDGLHIADCEEIPHWTGDATNLDTNNHTDYLAERLVHLYEEYPEFSKLYPEFKRDLNWLVMRWLEVLPVPSDLKIEILQEKDASNGIMLVRMMLEATEEMKEESADL